MEEVLDFFIPKVWHLSTRIFRSAHVAHLVKALQRYWLSSSSADTIAVSSANWNQCRGAKPSANTYPRQLTSMHLTHSTRVLMHRLKSRGDKQSPCSTPLLTHIGWVMKFLVKIDTWKPLYWLIIKSATGWGTWWKSNTLRIRLWLTSPKAFLKSKRVTTSCFCLRFAWLRTCVRSSVCSIVPDIPVQKPFCIFVSMNLLSDTKVNMRLRLKRQWDWQQMMMREC